MNTGIRKPYIDLHIKSLDLPEHLYRCLSWAPQLIQPPGFSRLACPSWQCWCSQPPPLLSPSLAVFPLVQLSNKNSYKPRTVTTVSHQTHTLLPTHLYITTKLRIFCWKLFNDEDFSNLSAVPCISENWNMSSSL